MAALKAAKPAQPTAAAWGPALLASIPPVIQPAATPFLMSFFARYYIDVKISEAPAGFKQSMMTTPSMQHSVPAKIAPTSPKFFAELKDLVPISLNPLRSCSRVERWAICCP